MMRATLLIGGWLLTLAQPVMARTYVVAVGNDRGRADEISLAFAESDAARLAAVLGRLGGVAPQNTVVVNGADADALRRTLLEVNARVRMEQTILTDASALIVYYSGHADAAGLHLGDSTLRYDELRAIVAASPATVRVLILDGCRSGGLTRVKGVTPAETFEMQLDDRIDVEGLAIMTSSAAGEDSHESDHLGGSFFSHHLLTALVGAGDRDEDGRVTLTEAYAYAYRQTLRSSGRTTSLQHPTYAYDIKGRGEFVLTRLDADTARSGRLRLVDPGVHLVRAGGEVGPLRVEVNAETPGTQLVLTEGRYFIQQRARDRYREYEVDISRGSTVDLAQQPHRVVQYARLVRKGGGRYAHGMMVLGALHGEVIEGRGSTSGVLLGYHVDLAWGTVGLRGRWGRAVTRNGDLKTTQSTLAAGLTLQRYLDFSWMSVGVGVLVESVRRAQRFTTPGVAPMRSSWGIGFGGLAAVELPVSDRLALRIEGGPITQVLRHSGDDNGAAGVESTITPLTGWGGGGLTWRY